MSELADRSPTAESPGPRAHRARGLRARLHSLATEHASTAKLSVGAGVGVLVGCTPFYGLHAPIGFVVARLLRLNQLAVLVGEQISLPVFAPVVTFSAVQIGHRALEGSWLSLSQADLSLDIARQLFSDWLLGGLLLGCALGLALMPLVYAGIWSVRRLRGGSQLGAPSDEAAAAGQKAVAPRRWSGRSRGSTLGYSIMFGTLRLFGRRGAYALLWPVVGYFFVFAPGARRASADYLRRLLGPRSWWQRQRDFWRHIHSFAKMLVDQVAVLGSHDDFRYTEDGLQNIRDARRADKGVILLTAHAGARAIAGHRLRTPMNIVMYEAEADRLQRYFKRIGAEHLPRVIPADGGPAASAMILRSLRRGELVGMLADRAWGERWVSREFLGGVARFPLGPFAVAAISGAPVVITFGARSGTDAMHLQASKPIELGRVPRDERDAAIERLVDAYVAELERFVRRFPYQWYNFYRFWE